MKIKTFQFNPVGENTYVLYDETKECVIIDPGCFFPDEKVALFNFIVDNELIIKHLINTHLHFDHILGSHFVEEKFNIRTQAHKDDEFLATNLQAQLQMFGFDGTNSLPPRIEHYLEENDFITFGNQKLVTFHVPGHSPGSLVFYNQASKDLFVGDVLFRGSVGRTDLEGGNHEQLISGIKEKLLGLPADVVIHSGHGPVSTIGDEKKINPFLR